MTLPSIATIETYGGKINQYGRVEDPTVERSAAETNEAMADLAGLTQVADRAYALVSCGSTPALVQHFAVWGSSPVVAPLVAITGNMFTVTWPTSSTDALGNAHVTNITSARVAVQTSPDQTKAYSAQVVAMTANSVSFQIFQFSSGAMSILSSFAGNVAVWAR